MVKKLLLVAAVCMAACTPKTENKIVKVQDGFAIVEAEDFVSQEIDDVRKWYVIDSEALEAGLVEEVYGGASNGKYIQVLPDTRKTHDDVMDVDVNFCGEAGVKAIVGYDVEFAKAGRYYIWVSCYSTGTEDNGIHVGFDDRWPESGVRMQWCANKNQWAWENRQRTEEEHCGIPGQIWLDIPAPGTYRVKFSMREDGFAFDRFAISDKWDVTDKADKMGRVYIEDMKADLELIKERKEAREAQK